MRLYVSIQNVSGLFRTAASQRRDLPPPEELFFPPFPTVSTPERARPPHNMWHVRGLVISSQNWTPLASSFVCTIRSRGPFAPALCGISGPYSRVIDFCFCSPTPVTVAKLFLRYSLLSDSDIFYEYFTPYASYGLCYSERDCQATK